MTLALRLTCSWKLGKQAGRLAGIPAPPRCHGNDGSPLEGWRARRGHLGDCGCAGSLFLHFHSLALHLSAVSSSYQRVKFFYPHISPMCLKPLNSLLPSPTPSSSVFMNISSQCVEDTVAAHFCCCGFSPSPDLNGKGINNKPTGPLGVQNN